MKKVLYILLLVLNSCYAQNVYNNSNKIKMYIKNYNSKIEKLDNSTKTKLSSLAKTEKNKLPEKLDLKFQNKNLTVHKAGDSYVYRQYDGSESYKNIQTNVEIFLEGGAYFSEKIDELFYYGEVYYPNGNMYSKGISSWLGFSINKGYKYNVEGELIETIDYDEGYNFNYEDVFKFCKKNKIDIKNDIMNKLLKGTLQNGKKVWNIEYNNPITNKLDLYQLDGNTGDVIQKVLDKEKRGIKHY